MWKWKVKYYKIICICQSPRPPNPTCPLGCCSWWWWWLSNVCSVKTKFNFFHMFVQDIKTYIYSHSLKCMEGVGVWNGKYRGWENTSISGPEGYVSATRLLISPLGRSFIRLALHIVAQCLQIYFLVTKIILFYNFFHVDLSRVVRGIVVPL